MPTPPPTNPTTNGARLPDHHDHTLTFQFLTPDGSAGSFSAISAEEAVEPTNGARPDTPVSGMSAMIERKFNVQDRAFVPEPKRRKIDVAENGLEEGPGFRGRSSGLVGTPLQEIQAETTVAPSSLKITETVDLTDSITPRSSSSSHFSDDHSE